MRNLEGYRFPHICSESELRAIERKVVEVMPPDYTVLTQLAQSERDFLVGCRFASPDFRFIGLLVYWFIGFSSKLTAHQNNMNLK